jgi:predicted DNA-binding transcriptional regulator AlpA
MSAKTSNLAAPSTPPVAASEALLTPKQAAQLLNLSTSWLAKQRLKGGGPPYVKLGGAIRYRLSDLQLWMKARLRLSTSGP